MLKTLYRILIILLVSGLVAGGMYVLIGNDANASGLGNQFGEHGNGNLQVEQNFGNLTDGNRLGNDQEQHFGETNLTFFQAIGVVFSKLIVVALITAAIVMIQRLFSCPKCKKQTSTT